MTVDKKPTQGKKEFIIVGESRFEVTPQGLFFCPGGGDRKKKHPCPDCHFCQWCSDSRCNLCRQGPEGCRKGKGSPD
jgi:hypothetical protein